MEEDRSMVGDKILRSKKSADIMLYEMFQLYKEDLHRVMPQMYYAMLAWKHEHLNELLKQMTPPLSKFQDIEVGDLVKVIAETQCGDELKELIPIGTLCTVIKIETVNSIVGYYLQPVGEHMHYYNPYVYVRNEITLVEGVEYAKEISGFSEK